jgi:hypothetical protein
VWELAEQSAAWTEFALMAESAEGEAEKIIMQKNKNKTNL